MREGADMVDIGVVELSMASGCARSTNQQRLPEHVRQTSVLRLRAEHAFQWVMATFPQCVMASGIQSSRLEDVFVYDA